MKKHIKHIYKYLFAVTVIILTLISCERMDEYEPSADERQVFLMYTIGYNNLSSYIRADINELAASPLPAKNSKDVMLICSHLPKGSYSNPNPPVLFRLYKDKNGNAVRDTLLVMEPDTPSASAETLHDVLLYVKEKFPAKSYGMLMSSHASGWLPQGYSVDTLRFDTMSFDQTVQMASRQLISAPIAVPYKEKEQMDGKPFVKSFGYQYAGYDSAYEIDVRSLAAAFPMKFDYLIFDACFMGGIEVAYELKDVCDLLCASQTEILGEGMDYQTLTQYLILESEADLKGFSNNYYYFYNNMTGDNQSACISLVDCRELEPLRQFCEEYFETHREEIAALEDSKYQVQRYWRRGYETLKWFYDLESIIKCSGANAEELSRFYEAIDRCILYKAATEYFIGDFRFDTYSGLSMYLPISEKTNLNKYYKTLLWNKATQLIK